MDGKQTKLSLYLNAMIAGQHGLCSRIEQEHGLYGYPPAIVSVGLKAFDKGEDVQNAVAVYLAGEPT